MPKWALTIYILTFLVGVASMFRGCLVPLTKAISALENQGYRNVHIKDRDILFLGLRGCDSYDAVKFEAAAVNAQGDTVDVILCGGVLKGLTVRSN